jgi:hydroxymethylbilane synthase
MRIGTRGSALALAQARLVAGLLGGAEIVTIATAGDAPGAHGGDKSRWVAELERALLAGEIDLAVHSAKDVPGELAPGLAFLGAPARETVEDVLCGSGDLDALAHGARVGTNSLRRAAQLRAAREDLRVEPLRGNVDTRLGRLREGAFDAIVLARAGLRRLGREEEVGARLDPRRFVPSPGQGALAIEGRAGDVHAAERVRTITDPETFACLLAERALARELGASCHTPLGAHAERVRDGGPHADEGSGEAVSAPGAGARGSLILRAWVGVPDGSAWMSDELTGEIEDPEGLGRTVAERLRAVGAGELLARAEEMATEAGVAAAGETNAEGRP